MKKILIFLVLIISAASAFAQGTSGRLYFNKELGRLTYLSNTDSSDIRWDGPLCFGDGCPWQQAAASGTATAQLDSFAGTNYSRSMCYFVDNTTVTWYGIVRLGDKFRFTDTIKYWFSNRALANDTAFMIISRRTVGAICSVMVFNYGAALTDTIFRFALPTTATAGVRPDTVAVTFENAVKDSNSWFPQKLPNGFFMPCLFYQIKVIATGGSYYMYSFRCLPRWKKH